VYLCCACTEADVDNISVITGIREYQEISSHHHHHHHHHLSMSSAPAADISDVSTAITVPSDADSSDSATDDTVADVSTQFHPRSGDSHDVSRSGSSSHDLTVTDLSVQDVEVEPSSPDDRADSRQQQVDSNRAAIDLLLWKLTELERLITLGQVRHTLPCSVQRCLTPEM